MIETPQGALSERVGVVIGGGSGVGRAIALALARQGARIVVADFDEPRMQHTVEEVLRLGTSASGLAVLTDVRDDGSVRSLAKNSIKAMGRVDVLINAAAVLLQGKLDKISIDDWRWMLETNLLGAVRTSAAFLPHMSARGSGHIVNIVSHGGVHPGNPVTVPYDVGHSALAAFTTGLAAQVRGSGVHVSLLCLGSGGPRIGQNTRSRGLGRWLGDGAAPQEGAQAADRIASSVIDALQSPRFLIAADPADRQALEERWTPK